MSESGDLFLVLKVCVEPSTLLGGTSNRRMGYQYATGFPNTKGFESEFFVFLDRFLSQRALSVFYL